MARLRNTRKTPPAAPDPATPLPDAKLQAARRPSDQQQLLLGRPRGDLGAGFVHEHVDLAPHAEPARKVDPGLDREPDARHERALVRGLEVVDVRPRAVQVAIDRVAPPAGPRAAGPLRRAARSGASPSWARTRRSGDDRPRARRARSPRPRAAAGPPRALRRRAPSHGPPTRAPRARSRRAPARRADVPPPRPRSTAPRSGTRAAPRP